METQRPRGAAARRLAVIAGVAVVVAVVMMLSSGLSAASGAHPPSATALAKKTTHFTVGAGPNRAAYDPVDHDLYVPESGAAQVQVFSPSNALVGVVSLPSDSIPGAAAFDPQDNYVYVTDQNVDHVYLISGTSLKHTITSGLLEDAYGIAYNPGDGAMVVANSGSDDIIWIVGTEIAFTQTVGVDPFEVAYDPYWSEILVSNQYADTVTCIDAVYATYLGNVSVGTDPAGIAFDPANDYAYVANTYSDNVSVLNGAGGPCYLVDTISGFETPDGIGFDQATLQLYITNLYTGKVSTVATFSILKNYKTSSSAYPVDATYDPYNDDVYVGGTGAGTGTTMYVFT